MKKKFKILVPVLIIILLLIPIRLELDDGGTIEYTAVLYTVTKEHSIHSAKTITLKVTTSVQVSEYCSLKYIMT